MNVMSASHLLALAVDMPFMCLPQLTLLGDLIRPGCGILPKIGPRAEPLAAIYPRECLPHLTAALRSDDYSLQGLTNELLEIGLLQTFEVPPAETFLYQSINRPSDLATFSAFEQPIPAV